MIDDVWDSFRHVGNVPSLAERLDYLCAMGLQTMFPPYPVASCARGEYQEGFDYGVSHTKKWLIDAGCGWDLVQASHVSHLTDLLRTPHFKPLTWTANGVTRAEQEVPLCISELDEHCVPLVLKSTLMY